MASPYYALGYLALSASFDSGSGTSPTLRNGGLFFGFAPRRRFAAADFFFGFAPRRRFAAALDQ
jgi:hypothetical protein